MTELYLGDCLEIMPQLESNSFDLIICDLPYGTTKCKWDVVIPFDKLWEQYNRLIKEDGAIVLFGKEPFSSQLRVSNLDMYKYDEFCAEDIFVEDNVHYNQKGYDLYAEVFKKELKSELDEF